MRLPAGELLTRLLLYRAEKSIVAGRIIHVREHEVLPDEQPEFVARVEECIVLVDRAAIYPQHVQPGGLDLRESGVDRLRHSPLG